MQLDLPTYLPKNLTSYVNAPLSKYQNVNKYPKFEDILDIQNWKNQYGRFGQFGPILM